MHDCSHSYEYRKISIDLIPFTYPDCHRSYGQWIPWKFKKEKPSINLYNWHVSRKLSPEENESVMIQLDLPATIPATTSLVAIFFSILKRRIQFKVCLSHKENPTRNKKLWPSLLQSV